jgi:uncharacterized protein YdhG (YjbR/CyaY superfamily)
MTIDEYLAALSVDKRTALDKLRKAIKAVVPKAEECISYQLPAFRLDGRPLVSFGATANHCAFYPMSSSTVAAHKDELKDYDTSKGAIRFPANKPLPVALVRKLVKARIAENERRSRKSKHGKPREQLRQRSSAINEGQGNEQDFRGPPSGTPNWSANLCSSLSPSNERDGTPRSWPPWRGWYPRPRKP